MSDSPTGDSGRVHLSTEGPVATLLFDRPKAHNAMTWAMYETLAEACARLASDEAVRVVVLRGAGGKAFIAGTDIEQFAAFENGADGLDYEQRIGAYVGAVANLPQPTVAIIEGWAVGGGMAIASVCDLRLATPGARFGVPIARTLGNCLSAGNLRVLLATLGAPMVKRMLLLAEMVPAEDLRAIGYVHAIAPAGHIEGVCAEICTRLAANAPVTMRVTKQALARMIEAPGIDDEDLISQAYGSQDFHEGVAAFLAKRPPSWQGR